MTRIIRLRARTYQQFNADYNRDVPAEGIGGWRQDEVPLALEHTALVVMHAWAVGPPETHPDDWRIAEGNRRTLHVLQHVFPPLLRAVRASPMKLYHVVAGSDYYSHLPGYQKAAALAPKFEWWPYVQRDDVYRELRRFKELHNETGPQCTLGASIANKKLDFAPEARPLDHEPVVESTPQLFAQCNLDKVNHLVYIGFALNWCVQTMPCGMIDMRRHGAICSIIRQATTAIENKETARQELAKENTLWRIGYAYGFVFDDEEFIRALDGSRIDG